MGRHRPYDMDRRHDECAAMLPNIREHGFTLIELMVTIAVLAIIVTLAAPSFQATIENNRLTSQANELVTALALARSEAVRRNTPVTVCPGSCALGQGWADGWRVFAEPAGSDRNSANVAVGAELLRVSPALVNPLRFDNAAGLPVLLRFLPDGRVSDRGGAQVFPVEFDLSSPACTSNSARRIEITRLGRAVAIRRDC